MDELLDRLGKAHFTSVMDLTLGYWQVPFAKEINTKQFNSSFGFFQFRVMPFGLQGPPATFQRMMNQLVHGAHDYAATYLDDLVIYSATW